MKIKERKYYVLKKVKEQFVRVIKNINLKWKIRSKLFDKKKNNKEIKLINISMITLIFIDNFLKKI